MLNALEKQLIDEIKQHFAKQLQLIGFFLPIDVLVVLTDTENSRYTPAMLLQKLLESHEQALEMFANNARTSLIRTRLQEALAQIKKVQVGLKNSQQNLNLQIDYLFKTSLPLAQRLISNALHEQTKQRQDILSNAINAQLNSSFQDKIMLYSLRNSAEAAAHLYNQYFGKEPGEEEKELNTLKTLHFFMHHIEKDRIQECLEQKKLIFDMYVAHLKNGLSEKFGKNYILAYRKMKIVLLMKAWRHKITSTDLQDRKILVRSKAQFWITALEDQEKHDLRVLLSFNHFRHAEKIDNLNALLETFTKEYQIQRENIAKLEEPLMPSTSDIPPMIYDSFFHVELAKIILESTQELYATLFGNFQDNLPQALEQTAQENLTLPDICQELYDTFNSFLPVAEIENIVEMVQIGYARVAEILQKKLDAELISETASGTRVCLTLPDIREELIDALAAEISPAIGTLSVASLAGILLAFQAQNNVTAFTYLTIQSLSKVLLMQFNMVHSLVENFSGDEITALRYIARGQQSFRYILLIGLTLTFSGVNGLAGAGFYYGLNELIQWLHQKSTLSYLVKLCQNYPDYQHVIQALNMGTLLSSFTLGNTLVEQTRLWLFPPENRVVEYREPFFVPREKPCDVVQSLSDLGFNGPASADDIRYAWKQFSSSHPDKSSDDVTFVIKSSAYNCLVKEGLTYRGKKTFS